MLGTSARPGAATAADSTNATVKASRTRFGMLITLYPVPLWLVRTAKEGR
jgi:hypothetical protein